MSGPSPGSSLNFPQPEPQTAHHWRAWLTKALVQHGCVLGQGTLQPADEANWLVLRGLGLPFDATRSQLQRPLSADEQAHLKALLTERLVSHRPTAYLLNEAWLMGEAFDADERAIIPRSFIAEFLRPPRLPGLVRAPARILELCTGGGSLAILAAKAWPDAEVVATDLDPAALGLAQQNVHRHGLADRVQLLQGNLYHALPPQVARFDLILANPPYVPTRKTDALPPEFKAEPRAAFEGGPDGMDLVREIVQGAPAHLSPGGLLVVEIGFEAHACEALFEREFPHQHPLWLQTATGSQHVFALGENL